MDALKIYIDRLKDDASEDLDVTVESSHFGIEERELKLDGAVSLRGTTYRTNEHLIVELDIDATAQIPCSVCNTLFTIAIQIRSLRLTISIDEISNAIYDLTEEILSQILLKIPAFGECNGGSCPERKKLTSYLNQKKNLPFSDLNL